MNDLRTDTSCWGCGGVSVVRNNQPFILRDFLTRAMHREAGCQTTP